MKSLDQVDSFTKEASGHILYIISGVASTPPKYSELTKMQSGVGAYGLCIVFTGFLPLQGYNNSSLAR
jgi:hypothetical protein